MFSTFVFVLVLLHIALATAGGVQVSHGNGGRECTVKANGNKEDDTPNIAKAFAECSPGGTIIFPEKENLWIATKLNPVANDVTIEWRGTWTLSDDLAHWRKRTSTYPIAFQNHATAFILSGSNIRLHGHSTGGIHGNGEAWYNDEEAHTRAGRPMPFVLWNVTNVVVKDFFVKQPPLWAVNVMNGSHLTFENIYVNATASRAPWGKNWVQNTDGFDTMDCNDVTLRNFIYQGGDDCIAIKPRSYNIEVQNVTCRGGNGIAIGSLGQYLEDSSVENVSVRDVKIVRYNEDMHNSAYIKTWIGHLVPQNSYESEYKPRGGGWGRVRNLTFSNFQVEGADSGPAITQDNGNNGSFSGTSKIEISNVKFENFRGYLGGKKGKETTSSVNCSKTKPCSGIEFRDVKIRPKKEDEGFGSGRCVNVPLGAVKGLKGSGCS